MSRESSKLVRDHVPASDHAKGIHEYSYSTAEGDALRRAAMRKIVEEAGEIGRVENPEQAREELGDLLAAMKFYAETMGIPWEEVLKAQQKKEKEKGPFSGIISTPK